MQTPYFLSVISGLLIGVVYAILFKRQTKSLMKGFVDNGTVNPAKAIAKHFLLLANRFLVLGGILFILKSFDLVNIHLWGIFVVCGFLAGIFWQIKRVK